MAPDSTIRHRVFYKSLPKIELHRHLEGSLRLTTMIEIARKHNLDLPVDDPDAFNALVQVNEGEPFDFQNFLSKFATLRLFYQSPEAIRRFAREAVADAAADKIRYLELRFTPVALTRIRDFPMADAMDWVIETVQEASEDYGVDTRLIASVNRHESLALAEDVAVLSAERISRGVVGMDLAGNEAEFPGKEFTALFQEARQAGLRTTIHAGEWGGSESIRLAIETLGAERIGHGVRVMEDPDLTTLAAERQIPFEVCPTSNYQSGVVTDLSSHPLPKMVEAGLRVTLNTDDPGISQIDLSDEYELGCEVLSITPEVLRELILNAARSAFLSPSEIDLLVMDMEEELAELT
ncbi:MAG: adenosine deaminase [Anaerolineales bacterium]|jgi:adenosine deaminase